MFIRFILQRNCLRSAWQYIRQKRMVLFFIVLTIFLLVNCIFLSRILPHVLPIEWEFLPRNLRDHQTLYDTFYTFDDAMNRANVTYVMTMGTLIGLFRHHGIIPWDHDIDVMANSSDKAKVLQALRHSPGSNFYLEQRWEGLRRFYKNYYIYAGIVDIWFYEENPTHLLGKYIFDKRHLFPLTRRPFGDQMSWAACDPVRSLEDIQVNVFDCVDEKPWKRGPVVPCSEIEHMYPMVRRVPVSGDPGAVDEMLMFRGMVLKRVRLRYGTDCWSSNPTGKYFLKDSS